jgi:uncharacterized protein YjiS (DUF1127 family)
MNMDISTAQLRPRASRPSLLSRLSAALALRRHRRRLGQLDSHLLRDIGLSESEARTEAERALWDVPNHWLR